MSKCNHTATNTGNIVTDSNMSKMSKNYSACVTFLVTFYCPNISNYFLKLHFN